MIIIKASHRENYRDENITEFLYFDAHMFTCKSRIGEN